ncbi:MAG: 50S ribosomal protein L11 methyltransferase [Candidatus Cryptobacteroides sp.]
MDSQDYCEVAVRVGSEEEAEIIEAAVVDLGFDSFQFEDGAEPVLRCYIQTALLDEEALGEALRDVPWFNGGWECRKMEAADWNEQWEKSGFTEVEVGLVRVRPAGLGSGGAETIEGGCRDGAPASGEEITILLDPKMAFGTGHHDTTCMMMKTMQEHRDDISGKSVMDLGCGTAVLAILAAKLGAAEVSAVDIDATAVRSARGNIRLNGLDFEVSCSDASGLKKDAYDVLLANIHKNIIISDLPLYSAAVRQGGRLLLSGFYTSDVQAVVSAAQACGFSLLSSCSLGEWACLRLGKLYHTAGD